MGSLSLLGKEKNPGSELQIRVLLIAYKHIKIEYGSNPYPNRGCRESVYGEDLSIFYG